MTADGLRPLHDLRRQMLDPRTPLHRHTDPDDTDAKTVGAVA